MGEVIKWGLLAAGLVALIALVVTLPFMDFLNFGELSSGIASIVSVCGTAFSAARGLVNNFLTPFGRTVLSGLLIWLVAKWAIMISVKVVAWVYHFVFK